MYEEVLEATLPGKSSGAYIAVLRLLLLGLIPEGFQIVPLFAVRNSTPHIVIDDPFEDAFFSICPRTRFSNNPVAHLTIYLV